MARKDQSTLFETEELSEKDVPLAEKLRPKKLDDLRGQDKLIASNSLLQQMIEAACIIPLFCGDLPEREKPLLPALLKSLAVCISSTFLLCYPASTM